VLSLLLLLLLLLVPADDGHPLFSAAGCVPDDDGGVALELAQVRFWVSMLLSSVPRTCGSLLLEPLENARV
jgi:hypothetical protein